MSRFRWLPLDSVFIFFAFIITTFFHFLYRFFSFFCCRCRCWCESVIILSTLNKTISPKTLNFLPFLADRANHVADGVIAQCPLSHISPITRTPWDARGNIQTLAFMGPRLHWSMRTWRKWDMPFLPIKLTSLDWCTLVISLQDWATNVMRTLVVDSAVIFTKSDHVYWILSISIGS